jgi:hypothetical protein
MRLVRAAFAVMVKLSATLQDDLLDLMEELNLRFGDDNIQEMSQDMKDELAEVCLVVDIEVLL